MQKENNDINEKKDNYLDENQGNLKFSYFCCI